MVNAIDGYLGLPKVDLPGMLAPTGHHTHHDGAESPRATANRPVAGPAPTLATVPSPGPSAEPTKTQEA
jgi:hypothetical protein